MFTVCFSAMQTDMTYAIKAAHMSFMLHTPFEIYFQTNTCYENAF